MTRLASPNSSQPALRPQLGQPSWRLATPEVEAWVTRSGGHLGPVTFDRDGEGWQPLHVAPFATEATEPGIPPMLKALRGDFFCAPFGANEGPWQGEMHPYHGETANSDWDLVGLFQDPAGVTLKLQLETRVRPGTVTKEISLVRGHQAVYSRHILSGQNGPMTLGHHAMVQFPEEEGAGYISTGSFAWGQVAPEQFERPEAKGYSSLIPGGQFTDLAKVPNLQGGATDLTRYPARRGWDDLVQLFPQPGTSLGWTAVSLPSQGYVWLSLKDTRVLKSTILWHSNGGRHYQPWNGRHLNVMGLEEVTGYFHYGLAPSARPNPHTERGVATTVELQAEHPLHVNTIMAVAAIPKDFARVADVVPEGDGVRVVDTEGRTVQVPLNLGFLEFDSQ